MHRIAAFAIALALSSGVALGASGDLDPTWGNDGVARTLLERGPSREVAAHVVTVTQSGAVLVQGVAGHQEGTRPFLARYTSRGRLDRAFGNAGLLRGNSAGRVGVTLANGKIVLVGESVRRLLPNGRLDPSFGDGGRTRLRIRGCRYDATRAIRQPDGKIVLDVESCRAHRLLYDNTYALMRLHADGRLDRSFGNGGVATARVGRPYGLTFSQAFARQADGKLVLAGRAFSGEREGFALVRFFANGRIDRGFGRSGIAFTPMDDSPYIEGLFVRPDGKLLVGGCDVTGTEQPDETLIARYLDNGSLDQAWGSGGIRSYGDLGGAGRSRDCSSFATTSRDRLLVLGDRLWRLNRDGTFDSSFGSGGSIPVRPAEAFAVQRDGKIVAAGGLRFRRHRKGLDVRRYLA